MLNHDNKVGCQIMTADHDIKMMTSIESSHQENDGRENEHKL